MPPPERIDPDRREDLREREDEEEIRAAIGRHPSEPDRTIRGFVDRRDAGEHLAVALRELLPAGAEVVVLAIPRGGVEVGAVVAESLHAPLDVVIPRKVGAPGNPELGLGAVAEGVEVLDAGLISALGVDDDYLRREVARQMEEIRRRTDAYRGGRRAADLRGKVAVVVDDGVATGGTAVAALRWARGRGATRVILAVPVAPAEGVRRLRAEADDVVALISPEHFFAVGQWFGDFPQVGDERVVRLLRELGAP
jgi:predicted phosphoribosyltransferase